MTNRTTRIFAAWLLAIVPATLARSQVELGDDGVRLKDLNPVVQFGPNGTFPTFTGGGTFLVLNTTLSVGGNLISSGAVQANANLASPRLCLGNCIDDGVLEYDEGRNRIEATKSLGVQGLIQAGIDDFASDTAVFNFLGNNNASSGDMGGDGDLYVQNDVEMGDSLYLSRQLFMEGRSATGGDGNQSIFFYDNDSRSENYLRWDDARQDVACSDTNPTESAFVWNLEDNGQSAWLLTNGTDVELKLDDEGDMAIDGTLTQSGSCDLAETFLGPELDPGTVVAVDLEVIEGVVVATEAYQPTLVGVVSTDPGVLLNGPTADFYEHGEDLAEVKAALAANPSDVELLARKTDLEALRDNWRRGNLAIALAGRVPVKVDGSYGAIRIGDPLTSSPTAGHAMVMDRPGPTLGLALSDFDGERGEVLLLVRSGWHSGVEGGVESVAEPLANSRFAGGLSEASRVASGLPELRGQAVVAAAVPETLRVAGSAIAGYQPVSEPVEIGDVLVVDRAYPGLLEIGSRAADPAVVGFVSGSPGLVTGTRIRAIGEVVPELADALERAKAIGDRAAQHQIWEEMERSFESVHAPVAMSGIVVAKVDASYGAIGIGDLLAVSPTPGHVMRSESAAAGTIVAKALEPLAEGIGRIDVLVMLR